jgi:enoyl-CoA hydratase/carnithine racemase
MAIDYTKQGKIAFFTINRPEVLNAINDEVRRELKEAMEDFRDDPELWVGIVHGSGNKAFSTGADVKERHSGMRDEELRRSYHVADKIWKPFIAAISGYCLGGGLELALTCDIRIAAEHSTFGFPEIMRGGFPGGGGTQRIVRFVPRAKAAELLFMPRNMDANEAYHIGLINKVVPSDQLMPTVIRWAEEICRAAPLGIRGAKEAMLRGFHLPLEEGLQLESSIREIHRASEDYQEGGRAFVEKRKPVWKGR